MLFKAKTPQKFGNIHSHSTAPLTYGLFGRKEPIVVQLQIKCNSGIYQTTALPLLKHLIQKGSDIGKAVVIEHIVMATVGIKLECLGFSRGDE